MAWVWLEGRNALVGFWHKKQFQANSCTPVRGNAHTLAITLSGLMLSYTDTCRYKALVKGSHVVWEQLESFRGFRGSGASSDIQRLSVAWLRLRQLPSP